MMSSSRLSMTGIAKSFGPTAALRGVHVEVRVLVLDEPTSALTQADAQRLFALVRRLRDRGVSVIYISHFLEEVEAIADRFTVLRDGLSVGTGAVRDFQRHQIIEQMV